MPTAGLLLVAAAAASDLFDRLDGVLTFEDVQRIATLALVVILFEGGSNIGLRRFRASAAPILALGVLGTFGTAALVAVAAHYALGFSWTVAGLLGAALAPTDPAVTFSVLAGRDVSGRSGTILEGESGFNDPVGIALMIGMIEVATHDDASPLWTIVEEFVREMAIGLAVGVAGALALATLIRRAPLPDRTLYPIAVILAAGVDLRRRHRRKRLRLPRGLRRRHPRRRHAVRRPERGAGLQLGADRPRRAGRLRRARADGRPGADRRCRALVAGSRARGAARRS